MKNIVIRSKKDYSLFDKDALLVGEDDEYYYGAPSKIIWKDDTTNIIRLKKSDYIVLDLENENEVKSNNNHRFNFISKISEDCAYITVKAEDKLYPNTDFITCIIGYKDWIENISFSNNSPLNRYKNDDEFKSELLEFLNSKYPDFFVNINEE